MLEDTYICPQQTFLLLMMRNIRARLMALQLLNMGCSFLACIMFPHKGLGKLSTQNFVAGDQ